MGVELHPAFHPRVPGLLFQAEGKALIDRLKALSRLARQRGVAPLTSFMDNRAVPDDDAFDFSSWQAQWEEWLSPVRTVQELLDAVRSPAPTGKRVKDVETVLHDLEELARCLRDAAKHGARFRLEVR